MTDSGREGRERREWWDQESRSEHGARAETAELSFLLREGPRPSWLEGAVDSTSVQEAANPGDTRCGLNHHIREASLGGIESGDEHSARDGSTGLPRRMRRAHTHTGPSSLPFSSRLEEAPAASVSGADSVLGVLARSRTGPVQAQPVAALIYGPEGGLAAIRDTDRSVRRSVSTVHSITELAGEEVGRLSQVELVSLKT